MELKKYLQILMHWIWLLILCIFMGAGLGYAISRLAEPTYQATTKILISKDLSDQNSQFAAMSAQQMIDANVQLLSSASVVDEVSRRLNTKIDIQNIAQIQQVRSTPVIQVVIEDSNPQRAAAIANTLVQVLIDQNMQASGYASTEAGLKDQLSKVEDQISTLQAQFNQTSSEKIQSQLKQVNDQITTLQGQISKLSTEIGPLASLKYFTAEQSSQLAEKQAQLTQLQSLLTQYQQIRINLEYFGKSALNTSSAEDDIQLQLLQSTLDHYQTIYLGLLDNLQKVQIAQLRNIPTIEQIEKAAPPADPIRPRPLLYSMLGAIVGLLLAVGIVFIMEYVDDSLKTPQDVQQVLDVPVLGEVAGMQTVSTSKPGSPAVWQFHSRTQDDLYALRTNLELAVAQPPLKTLLVLNLNKSGKSKTYIAADLAVHYAQSGCGVVLLDGDLRNPNIHRYFGLVNEHGFSDLLAGDLNTEIAGKKVEGVDGMIVITGGNASPAAEGMLKSDKIVQILKMFKKQSDIAIIDAPSINSVNSWVLASKVDGVLLVVQSRVTHPSDVRQAAEQLNRVGATVLGVVLYREPHNLNYFYQKYLARRSS